jgi:2'-5' RNA ligase
MARRRLGVACLLPEPVRTEVLGLRRALGAPSLTTQPPHLTLVPPVNVRTDDVDAAIRTLHHAASSASGPLRLSIGPARSFGPVSPVAYLCVDGPDLSLVHAIRDRVFVPPLHRVVSYDYVPHVTLHEDLEDAALDATVALLSQYRVDLEIRALTILEQDPGDRVWRPFADVLLGAPIVRGRGGVEIHLRWSNHPAPDVAELCDLHGLIGPDRQLLRRKDPAWWLEARASDHALLGARVGGFATVADSHLGEGIEDRLLSEPEPEPLGCAD